jgi:hypothetical protein
MSTTPSLTNICLECMEQQESCLLVRSTIAFVWFLTDPWVFNWWVPCSLWFVTRLSDCIWLVPMSCWFVTSFSIWLDLFPSVSNYVSVVPSVSNCIYFSWGFPTAFDLSLICSTAHSAPITFNFHQLNNAHLRLRFRWAPDENRVPSYF